MKTRQPNSSSASPAAGCWALTERPNLPTGGARQSGFTLVEMILVIAINCVIIAVLLPAVQKLRAKAHGTEAKVKLQAMYIAEGAFFQEKGHFSASFDELGLGGEFQCADPGCRSRQNNGYLYEIILAPSGQSFTATGKPAVVGKTGSDQCAIDQTGLLSSAPIREAETVHKQMFDNINARAVKTIYQLILERPSDLQEVIRALEAPDAPLSAFALLDANGDGEVTPTEIVNYQGVGSDVLGAFLAFLGREMELGAGGENVSALPGVTLAMLQSPSSSGDIAMFEAIVGAGISNLRSDPGTGLPSAQLAGLSDGRVGFTDSSGRQPGEVTFNDGKFFAELSQPDPATPTAWAGTFTNTDQDGNFLKGVLIGLLSPGPGGPPMLQSILVATAGGGVWAGAVGNGQATIAWGDQGIAGNVFWTYILTMPVVQP